MSSSPRLVIYSADQCPWAHRGRIALKASGLPYETVEINLADKPEWYAPNINPASKVPALSYDAPGDSEVSKPPPGTFILPESALVVDFVASISPNIEYKDPVTRAKSLLLSLQYDNLVRKPYMELTQADGDEATAEAVLAAIKSLAPFIDDALLSTSEYGKGDILLAPFVTRNVLFLQHDVGIAAGRGKIILASIEATPEGKRFLQYHDKLAKWDAVQSTIDEATLIDKMRARLASLKK